MEKTEMIDPEKEKKSRKLILILALLGIGLALLAIIGLIKFGTVFFFIPFWFWTVDKIIELTGANLWLARGFAALFVLPFFYLLKLIFSWKAEKRMIGWILFSALTASLCFTMFFLSEDIYFSFKTGQAKKWYIETPAGEYKFSASPGYNTFWGIEYQQVTPEVIRKYVEQERAGKATKTTGDKEIVRAIPKENTPERTVEQTIPEVEQTIPEKVIVPQQATPKEIIPEKTAKEIAPQKPTFKIVPREAIPKETAHEKVIPKETVSEEVISTKTTGEITAKKTISKESPTASGWDDFEATPQKTTSSEAIPIKTTEKTENFSLSPEEEKLLVKEIKKIYPSGYSNERRLSDLLELLEKSNGLRKHEDLLYAIIKKGLGNGWSLTGVSIEAVGYLAKVGSVKSIPILIWAYAKTESSYDRVEIEEAVKAIKKREGID